MTTPADIPPWQDRPPWQIRLLQQIQDLAAQRITVLRNGYETYRGSERDALRSWHRDLHQLEQLRLDLVARAIATGLERPWIDDVLIHGHRGVRYTDTYRPPRTGQPAREELVEGIAADVWQLQHMACLDAARREHLYATGVFEEPDPARHTQFDRNMLILWQRAATVADSIGLSDHDRDQLWATSANGWQRIIAATVATYSDDELYARWHAHTDPAIHTQITRSLTTVTPHGQRGPIPPTPSQMVAAAEAVITAPQRLRGTVAPPAAPGSRIGAGIDAALPPAHAAAPGIDAASPRETPPPAAYDTGAEL
ncbi:hypothetical protein [Nocardia blacklockiae]|uniref:hypothetical protein n=1 Tax=Nocardia blacklockiae TaxID=480036 RepID=UPI00189462E7|nr:hypothetical protein [Nocardia blacklockiae]MBF6176041.1 hypothetical protein [Nocardia blacklockiae]